MSGDSFTTTTSRSWFSRIGSAFMGILFGLILFLGSFLLLAWNEGRAIHRAQTLELGEKQIISITADAPDAGNNGKLVHLTGTAEATGPVSDRIYRITASALKLRREVEMFQWKEESKSQTKKKLGGGEETTTTYSYSKAWSSSLIDSSGFQKPDGHANPGTMPVRSETFTAEGIHVGDFRLTPSLTALINNYVPRPVTAAEAKAAANQQSADIRITSGGLLYVGADPQVPVVGDLRISFQMAPVGPVSIIAGQKGKTFEPFAVQNLGSLELLESGTLSAAAMFQKEKEGNVVLTWILRLVGFVMMLIGLVLITNLFSVLASIVPFFGDIVGAGTGILAFIVALPLTLVIIALAWLAYRPLIGIPLLLMAVGSIVFGIMKLLKRRRKAPDAA